MRTCTVEGCAMCEGRSCAARDADDLSSPCAHDAVERHFGDRTLGDPPRLSGDIEARVLTS